MGHKEGFTLIETIIYIAILGFVLGGGLLAVYNILEGSGRTRDAMYREQEAYFIGRKIDAILSEAISVSVSTSTLGIDTAQGIVTIKLDSGKIILKRGNEEYQLNDPSIVADDLIFNRDLGSNILNTRFSLKTRSASEKEWYDFSHYLYIF